MVGRQTQNHRIGIEKQAGRWSFRTSKKKTTAVETCRLNRQLNTFDATAERLKLMRPTHHGSGWRRDVCNEALNMVEGAKEQQGVAARVNSIVCSNVSSATLWTLV